MNEEGNIIDYTAFSDYIISFSNTLSADMYESNTNKGSIIFTDYYLKGTEELMFRSVREIFRPVDCAETVRETFLSFIEHFNISQI